MTTATEEDRTAMWVELAMTVCCIDGDIYCDDDQTGVVLNACLHNELRGYQ